MSSSDATPPSNEPTTTPATDEIIDAEVLPMGSVSPDSLPPVQVPPSDYSEAGVPSFDFVRDKIENRIATAIGSEELAHGSPEGQQVDDMMRKRDEAAKKKLDEIRKSMGKG